MLMTEDGKTILAYSYSQPDGSFILECPQGPQQEFLLTTSRLGYEPYRQKIPAQTQQTEILLKESSLTLREVKVISSPIRRQGDTISYYMSNFHRPQDRNLADVLARMPGIHVQSDGRVQYDGKPINRFYIEDMNLLGERYSLATKNLSPSDIAAVQVYENHEPIKMLRDRSQTEQAALNIKLKDFSSPYTLRQKIHLPRVHLKNNTSILRLLGNVSAGIENESEYTHLPQKLMLSSSDSLPLFRSSHVGQSCRFNEGFSNTHITLNYKKHHQSFGLKCGIAWTWQKIESDLSPWPLVTDTFVNDLTWHTSRLYVEPSYRINYRNWTISSSASANHLRTNYSGKKATYTYIHPRLRLIFAPSGDFKFNAGYSYTTYYGDLNEMGTGYVLERYNLFSKGIEALQLNASQSINFGVFYKNISHFLQTSYLTIYSLYKDNLIPASFVRDIYTFSWWEQKDRLSSFWLNTLSASKLFMEISLTASINLSYNQSKSVVEQQGSSINYTQHSFGVEPSLKWKAKGNLNFDYTMNAFFSGISMSHRPIDSYIPLINHRLYTYFGVTDQLFFTCNLQHFYTKAPDISASNLLFADLGIQYDFQHLTLSLDWSNIFNRKLHVISGYNTINTVTQTDKLRPSEVLISLRFKH
ncbi:Plug domain-containing protein [Tannerella forsythia]|uniref:Plug domain-containing protein n=1 Tax=Tannerella forsythia TaxID=28112 RepID=UPI0028DB8C42|nr:Plug domain-containing protein [Tannerella forsythia]